MENGVKKGEFGSGASELDQTAFVSKEEESVGLTTDVSSELQGNLSESSVADSHIISTSAIINHSSSEEDDHIVGAQSPRPLAIDDRASLLQTGDKTYSLSVNAEVYKEHDPLDIGVQSVDAKTLGKQSIGVSHDVRPISYKMPSFNAVLPADVKSDEIEVIACSSVQPQVVYDQADDLSHEPSWVRVKKRKVRFEDEVVKESSLKPLLKVKKDKSAERSRSVGDPFRQFVKKTNIIKTVVAYIREAFGNIGPLASILGRSLKKIKFVVFDSALLEMDRYNFVSVDLENDFYLKKKFKAVKTEDIIDRVVRGFTPSDSTKHGFLNVRSASSGQVINCKLIKVSNSINQHVQDKMGRKLYIVHGYKGYEHNHDADCDYVVWVALDGSIFSYPDEQSYVKEMYFGRVRTTQINIYDSETKEVQFFPSVLHAPFVVSGLLLKFIAVASGHIASIVGGLFNFIADRMTGDSCERLRAIEARIISVSPQYHLLLNVRRVSGMLFGLSGSLFKLGGTVLSGTGHLTAALLYTAGLVIPSKGYRNRVALNFKHITETVRGMRDDIATDLRSFSDKVFPDNKEEQIRVQSPAMPDKSELHTSDKGAGKLRQFAKNALWSDQIKEHGSILDKSSVSYHQSSSSSGHSIIDETQQKVLKSLSNASKHRNVPLWAKQVGDSTTGKREFLPSR